MKITLLTDWRYKKEDTCLNMKSTWLLDKCRLDSRYIEQFRLLQPRVYDIELRKVDNDTR